MNGRMNKRKFSYALMILQVLLFYRIVTLFDFYAVIYNVH